MNRNSSLLKAAQVSTCISLIAPLAYAPAQSAELGWFPQRTTATPIEHVIVVIGENHTFDNLFGAYQPPAGQSIHNLLSQGIIKADGSPGPNFNKAAQQQAQVLHQYQITPTKTAAYPTLPQPNTTYATGQPAQVPDTRFPADLPNGPFQITRYVAYDAHTGDPVHRFFQMWQQTDGGANDLYVWTANTASTGPQNGADGPTPDTPYQGAVAMGFYNMSTGDAAGFAALARRYAISDNYHQPIMGGTGANFLALATGDVGYYTQGGQPAVPPTNQIENPNPQAGYNNWFTQDGYQGGSYVNCADASQPGVKPILDYLKTKPGKSFRDGNCAANTYYLVNNYSLAYEANGDQRQLGPNDYTLPPQTVPTIAESLDAHQVSWKWYSGGRNPDGSVTSEYCGICDPFTASQAVMTSNLRHNLQGMTEFYEDLRSEQTLPAVSFVRPYENMAGHPANATMLGYEQFINDLVTRVRSNPKLWAKTAIIVTFDEGGGYYDSGYIQPIDFFGDGPRIPLLVISPYAKRGHVDHAYHDHVSILKFIEANWHLPTLSTRSRDNLPNPVTSRADPYVPLNRPAIGDLMSLFWFDRVQDAKDHLQATKEKLLTTAQRTFD